MASSGSVFSQTLRDITNTKLDELAKKRNHYEALKAKAIKTADQQQNALERLSALKNVTKVCFGASIDKDNRIVRGSTKNVKLESDLRNIDRFIVQAKYDPSVSTDIIERWRKCLLEHLDVQSLKYQYADLYGKLTVEWLSASKSGVDLDDHEDTVDASTDFEEVSSRIKLESRRQWEGNVFTKATINEAVIQGYLSNLWGSQDAQKALQKLRQNVGRIAKDLHAASQFTPKTLRWVIKGLLFSDLLTNEKRQVLQDFLTNDVILVELSDVLNMRLANIEGWDWGEFVPLEQRRQLSGRFHIYMHEDLLQAIFLQYVGVKWSTGIKRALNEVADNEEVWSSGIEKVSPVERQRRAWYLKSTPPGDSARDVIRSYYRGGYFLSQLQDTVDPDRSMEEGEEEADFDDFTASAPRKQLASQSTVPTGSLFAPQAPTRMATNVATSSFGSSFAQGQQLQLQQQQLLSQQQQTASRRLFPGIPACPSANKDQYKPKNQMDAKQRLLHLLSTEILVKTRFIGGITCLRSQFSSWNSNLPHDTILAVLTHIGVSKKWLSFFKTFLQAPLKFIEEDEEPRLRRKGIPGAHALSDFFGEVVLFNLDFDVNQQTRGQPLWRTYDDFWFWSSDPQMCVQVWNAIQKFNDIMGTSLNYSKSASVSIERAADGKLKSGRLPSSLPKGDIRWGMLYLDAATGRFTIDMEMVKKHINDLQKQLKGKEDSIFSWVQAYSTYSTIFFTSNFGKPANCFGRAHIDMMLKAHEKVQRGLFIEEEGIASVADWLKKQIEDRFGIAKIPDGYLFFPSSLGGLEVKSPFMYLLQLRDSVTADPEKLLDKFESAEAAAYAAAKKRYEAGRSWEYQSFGNKEYRPEDAATFMPYKEFTKHREFIHYGFANELSEIYLELLARPTEDPVEIDGDEEIAAALNRIEKGMAGAEESTKITQWHNMEPYWKWVTMLHGPEMIKRFGGFCIVDRGLLPMGMVGLLRSGKISWQE